MSLNVLVALCAGTRGTFVTFGTDFTAPAGFAPLIILLLSKFSDYFACYFHSTKRPFYTIFLLKRIHSFYFQIFKHALVYT